MASPPGPITGVDFVTVPTNDFEAAVGFYGTTLGLSTPASATCRSSPTPTATR
jgi:hypothetical protein